MEDKNKQREVKSTKKSLWVFFWACLKISAFTFGGGHIIVPLQKRKFSDELQWIEEDKILDLVSIAQSAPGSIAINASAMMGNYLFGAKGVITAVVASILPPLVILSVISSFYHAFASSKIARAVLRGMQAAVSALLTFTVVNMTVNLLKLKSGYLTAVLILCLGLVLFTSINVIFVILIAALLALVFYGIDSSIERGH